MAWLIALAVVALVWIALMCYGAAVKQVEPPVISEPEQVMINIDTNLNYPENETNHNHTLIPPNITNEQHHSSIHHSPLEVQVIDNNNTPASGRAF